MGKSDWPFMPENAGTPDVTVKTFTLRVETPDGALPPVQVQVPDIPMGLADLVPFMYELCNSATALAIQKSGSMGKPVTCGPGCGVCCKQLVPLSVPEAVFLAHYVEGLAPEQSGEIKKRFAASLTVVRESGVLETITALDKKEDDDSAIANAYFSLNIPCPFLSANSCGIHRVRPCACREFNVTSLPQFCADPLQKKIARIVIHRKMTAALAHAASRLTGARPELVPFPFLFEWYERNEEYAALRWKGIGLFDLMLSAAMGENAGSPE
jgi:Fe-S-cluster containining protein